MTSGAVNTAFVLDMQRKLYRWSTAKPDKVFVDLFNIVCDRRTLEEAWKRMARNRGSQTPGTDGITLRIPTIAAVDSERRRPPVPVEGGQGFRRSRPGGFVVG